MQIKNCVKGLWNEEKKVTEMLFTKQEPNSRSKTNKKKNKKTKQNLFL